MSKVKLEKFINAPKAEVYHYFTSSTALRDWICDIATADPHPGGHLYLCWPGDYYSSGEYLKLEKDKSLSFTWFGRGEPHKTRVDVVFKKQKGGTLLNLIHREIGKGQKWAEIAKVYEVQWRSALENLASILENGSDLRITRRPMIGVIIDDFNAEIAAKLGIPVDYGTRLSDVVDGMGAQKAGLQKDDVIISVDGHDLTTGTTLTSYMASKHAGDGVDLVYYRGSEKRTAKMKLSGRPIPPMPSSGLDLSIQVEPIYKQFENEIEEIINNASEIACSHKPNASEWSAKEVLAHLIHSELGWQNAASEIIGGAEALYDAYGGNVQARVEGTMAIFKTKDELLKELENHDAETISMMAHLPKEFLLQKGRFWKLTYQAHQNIYHQQLHIEQMRAAIQSVQP
jgi:uncharacterized protein YndB with AHSA1/START domain